MSSVVLFGTNQERIISMTGERPVKYAELIARASRGVGLNNRPEQVEISNHFEQSVKRQIATTVDVSDRNNSYDLIHTAQHFNDADLALHLNNSAQMIIDQGKVALNKTSSVNIEELNVLSNANNQLKSTALVRLQPLIKDEFNRAQKVAMEQPKPKGVS